MDQIDEQFIRHKLDENKYPENINFQALSWYTSDFDNDDDINSNGECKKEYNVCISGVTDTGHSITVILSDFKPYFYVQIPDNFMDFEVNKFYNYIKNRLRDDSYGLESYSVTKKQKLFPYLMNKKFRFMKLKFTSDKTYKRTKNMFVYQDQTPIVITGIENQVYEYFETNVEHLNRFCHVNDLQTTGWIKVNKYEHDFDCGNSQINIKTKSKYLKSNKDINVVAPLTIFSWDIECLPENTEEFPNPELPNDIICLIGVVIHKYGTEYKQKFVFTGKPCSKVDGVVIIEGSSEKELLVNFCNFVGKVCPDFIIGYNTWGFDDNYLWKRLNLYDIDCEMFSRISRVSPSLKKKELSSNAYGNNEYNYIDFVGRETFDVIEAIRREHKLPSYSLNTVSEHFLGKHKVDLPYRELFNILADNNPDGIAKGAEYCIEDSNLPLELVLKLNMIPNYIEMAKTTYVPISWLLFRGQQCKVFSLIVKAAMIKGLIIPVYNRNGAQQYKFKGATVLNAYTGLYYDPIAGLDFASLYPSIMIAYNMCYSTYIADEKTLEYVNKNGIPYETIEWEEDLDNLDDLAGNDEEDSDEEALKEALNQKKINNTGVKKYSFSFVQIEDKNGNVLEKGQRGLLGEILLELWQGRKATKKLMKNEKDEFMYAVLNGKQLAQKVTMNSIYGFTGADKGIFPLKPIAASVTATGRKMIEETSSMAKERYGAITIYGDSIPGYEVITLKKENNIKEISIENFANEISKEWDPYRGFKLDEINIYNKFYKNIEGLGYYAYTHEGYQPIKKVIKHDTTKKLYKIIAKDSNGNIHSVIVTEGHSLIDINGNLLKANSAKVGDLLWNYVNK